MTGLLWRKVVSRMVESLRSSVGSSRTSIGVLSVLLCLLLCAGCLTADEFEAYRDDRLRDAADIFTLAWGVGVGAKGRVGPLGTGVLLESTGCGLRGGEFPDATRQGHGWFLPSSFDAALPVVGIESFDSNSTRGKNFKAGTLMFVNLTDESYGYYYGQVEVVAALGVSLRAGFNLWEFADFILGFAGVDIAEDDENMSKLRNPPDSRPTAGLAQMLRMAPGKYTLDELQHHGWRKETRSVTVVAPEATKETVEITFYRDPSGIEFVLVPAGSFMIGSPSDEEGRKPNEGLPREVRISAPFLMAAHEFTCGQYKRLTGAKDYQSRSSANRPWCEGWGEAVRLCEKLGLRDDGRYRPPTEEEWEYACRAGTTTRYSCGDLQSSLALAANPERERKRMAVGRYAPNRWGLYDMHGSLDEFCYPAKDETTADGVTLADFVLRGGRDYNSGVARRSAQRKPIKKGDWADGGLRLVYVLKPDP